MVVMEILKGRGGGACLLRFEVLRSNAAFSKVCPYAPSLRCCSTLDIHVNKTQSGAFERFNLIRERILRYGGESAGILCVVLTVHERSSIFQHLDPRLRGQRLPTSGKGAPDPARMFGFPSSLVSELCITLQ